MTLKRMMLSIFGLAVLFGSFAPPADAQRFRRDRYRHRHDHRHCFYRHHRRICR